MRFYYVLDTETTGFSVRSDSLIEIAAIKVRDGRIRERFHTFVNPRRPIPADITALTGISDADVFAAPYSDAAAMELARFLSDAYPIVGHNITFDLRFIQAAFEPLGIKVDFRYVDTLTLARRAFPDMPDYKLDTLVERLNLSDHAQAHRAMEDVMMTHALFLACQRRLAPENDDFLVEYRPAAPVRRRRPPGKRRTLPPTVDVIDCTNPLYGKAVSFTGDLLISREDAKQIVVNCGGLVKDHVSRLTDYLVIGRRDPAYGTVYGKSHKEKKADALNAEGVAHIEYLNEFQFFRLIPLSAIPGADGIALCYEPEDELL